MTPSIGRSDTGASRSILSPVFLGPATLLQSSAPLNWGGVLVEKYACRPGERGAGNVLDAPVIASPPWARRSDPQTFIAPLTRASIPSVLGAGAMAAPFSISCGED